MDILICNTVCVLKEFKKKIIPKFYVLLKKVLKVNLMTVGVHKAGPDKFRYARCSKWQQSLQNAGSAVVDCEWFPSNK